MISRILWTDGRPRVRFPKPDSENDVWRAGRKGDAGEDLDKARWYIEDARMNVRLTDEQKARAETVLRLMAETGDLRMTVIKLIARGKCNEAFLRIDDLEEHLRLKGEP